MSLNAIVSGDFGQIIELTLIDTDTNAAADVSAYTTAQLFYFKDPLGNISSAKTAAFTSDGSDGKVRYTLITGDIDQGGVWAVRAQVKTTSAILSSKFVSFDVESAT